MASIGVDIGPSVSGQCADAEARMSLSGPLRWPTLWAQAFHLTICPWEP
jgi:hypothetical protein